MESNVRLMDVMNYFGSLEAWVLEWALKSEPAKRTLHHLSKVDEETRRRWMHDYRENVPDGITFSQIIQQNIPYLEMRLAHDVEEEWGRDKERGDRRNNQRRSPPAKRPPGASARGPPTARTRATSRSSPHT